MTYNENALATSHTIVYENVYEHPDLRTRLQLRLFIDQLLEKPDTDLDTIFEAINYEVAHRKKQQGAEQNANTHAA